VPSRKGRLQPEGSGHIDVVLSLSRPSDYVEREAARFVLKFRKFRGLHGADVEDIEAALATDATGAQQGTLSSMIRSM
jgi:hypothetical protein